jgi:phosphate transport system ATP-binding protein
MEEEQKVAMNVEHFNAWYGKTQALYDVNLTIAPLSVTALIGPSGCGKSTLLRCFNRMHEELPGASVAGLVQIEGVNIYARSIKPMYVRLYVGMVFQQPNPLPTHNIWQNVAIGAQINGLAKGKALHERVERSLREAALWDEVKDRLHSSTTTLSGGQQQRLCIARALAIKPKILLMDEPASALDPESAFKIENLIQELKKQYTIVIVTHNMQQAARIADTTAFLFKGQIVEVGETQQLFTRPQKQETEDYITGRFS